MKTSRASLPRIKAIALAVATCFAATPWTTLQANPQNPQVAAGQAVFQQTGSTLTVTNTPGAVINWQSFNIDRGELTRFVQQNAASQVLNRVIGSADPSQILGTLQSNGRVLLINPNGVVFGSGSQVDVAGLVVSSLNLSNEDFLSGKLRFTSNGMAGAVKTEGTIKTASGGSVVLIAPRVENSGIIQTPEGSILLAAGRSVEIVDLERRDIRVEVTNSEQQAINLGSLLAKQVNLVGGLVKNSGVIQASTAVVGENGKVLLKGRYAAENTGTIQANGTQGGDILIQATEGSVAISGTIEAKGLSSATTVSATPDTAIQVNTGQGGRIEILAQTIRIEQANIDASGDTGGGAILIGGDFRGGSSTMESPWAQNAAYQRSSIGNDIRFIDSPVITEMSESYPGTSNSGLPIDDTRPQQPGIPNRSPLQTARTTYIGTSSRIRADAMKDGNGGTIIIWSNEATESHATISAIGAGNGFGGLVETSSRGMLKIDQAPQVGNGGLWLIDPYDITVVDSDTDGDSSLSPSASNTTIAASLIVSVLDDGGSVTLDTSGDGYGTAEGNIRINAAINKTGTSDSSLTLNAHQNIFLNASITSNAGKLDLNLNADIDRNGSGQVYLGDTTINLYGGTINAANSLVEINTGSAEIDSAFNFGQLTLSGGNLTLKTGTALSLTTPLNISSGTLIAEDDLSVMQLYWSGGMINGSGKLMTPSGSYSQLDGDYAVKILANKTWENSGQIDFKGGELLLTGDGVTPTVLNNQTGGVINISSYYGFQGSVYSGELPLINNAGTLNWLSINSGGVNNLNLSNSGLINISGNLTTQNTLFTSSGTVNLQTDSTLTIYNGTIALDQGHVFTGDGTISIPYGAILEVNTPSYIANPLHLEGTLVGHSDLTLNRLYWTGGYITGEGGLYTPTGSEAHLTNNTAHFLQNKTWNNSGLIDLAEGSFILYGAGVDGARGNNVYLNNLSGGTININSAFFSPIEGYSYYGEIVQLNNFGTINWNASYTDSNYSPRIQSLDFNNAGIINVNQALTLSGTTGIDKGHYNIAADKELSYSGSYRQIDGAALFSGLGTIRITDGSFIEFTAPQTLQNPIILSGGTLSSDYDLSIKNISWLYGSLTGSGLLITPADGVATLIGTGYMYLDNKSWDNFGTINLEGGTLELSSFGGDGTVGASVVLRNRSGGIINQNSTSSLTPIYGSNYNGYTPSLINDGVINWNNSSAEYNYSEITSVDLYNYGLFNVNANLNLNNSNGVDTGTYVISQEQSLTLNNSYRNLINDASISGNGTLTLGYYSYLGVSSNPAKLNPGLIYIAGGSLLIDASAYNSATLNTPLWLDDAWLDITGNLAIKDLRWSGGEISGTGTLITPSNGIALLDSFYTKTLSIANWENFGNIQLTAGQLYLANYYNYGTYTTTEQTSNLVNTTLTNQVNGVIDVSSQEFYPIQGAGQGTSILNNFGTINWNSVTEGYALISSLTFNNYGTFNANKTLGFYFVNGEDSGTYNIAANSNLVLDYTSRDFLSGATLNGSGNIIVNSGSNLYFSTPILINPNLILNGGYLEVPTEITVKNLTWNAGEIAAGELSNGGKLITPTGAYTKISTGSSKLLENMLWENSGTIDINEGYLLFNINTAAAQTPSTTGIKNNASGIININGGTSTSYLDIYAYGNGGFTPSIENFGTINWQPVSTYNTNIYGFIFNNHGQVNINNDLAMYALAGTDSGTYQIAPGATFAIYSSQRTLSSTANITGSGTLSIYSGSSLDIYGSLDIADTGYVNIYGGQLNLASANGTISFNKLFNITDGTLNATNDISFKQLVWSGGNISGTGKLITPTGGTATLDSSFSKELIGKTWENQGTINLLNGTLYLASYYDGEGETPSTINNLNTGILNIASLNSIPLYSEYTNNTLTNDGIINWQANSAGTTSSIIGIPVINNGVFNIFGGGATAEITDSLQQSGTLILQDNPTLWLPNLSNSGIISGAGNINLGDGYGKLINTGIISPGGDGAIGMISVIGDADLSNGQLNIDMQNNAYGFYDQLYVTNNLSLGGTLSANLLAGYTPAIGDFAPFLRLGGASSGTFSQTLLPADFAVGYQLASGEASRLIYGGSSTRVFTNAYGGLNWENPGNWSGNILPRVTDDVLISSAGNAYAVTHASGNDQIRNLTINAGNSLDISGGSLIVSGITDLTGLLSISGNGQATLQGALQGGTSGQVVVNGGTLYLNSPSSITQLNLNAGSLTSSGTLDIGDMNWSSALSGSGPVNVYGTLAINPGASRSSGLFNNYGTATMASVYFGVPLNDGAIFNNYGTLNINSNAEFWQGSSLASPVNTAFNPYNYYGNGFDGATGSRFVNQVGGVFNRNDSVNGSIFYGLAFDNLGTLNFGNGDLALRAGGTMSGSILRQGTSLGYLALQGGNFNLSGELGTNAQIVIQDAVGQNPQVHINANLQLAQGARIERQSGLLDWTNGWLQLDSGSTLATQGQDLTIPTGGVLAGLGTVDLGTGTLINQGTILPGGDGLVGTFNILGNYTQASSGILSIDLASSSQADQLNVSGNLAVDGTLTAKTLTGYTPQEGDVASILGFGGTGSGSFSNLSLPSGFTPSYNRAAGEWTRLIYSTTGQNIFTNAQGGNTWENPLNWLFGLPQASDNVLISGGNAVTHNSGNDSIASLSIDAGNSLAILGGSLSISGLTKVLGTLSASSNQMLHLGTNSEINQLNIGDSFTFSSGSALIRQLQAQGLNVQGGSLTLGNTATDASSLNGGALAVSGGSLILGGGNVDVGTANITAPGQLLYQGGQLTGLSSMSNTGTLSFGNTTISYPVFNTGTINLSGGVTFNSLFTNQGGTLSMAGTNTFLAGLTQDSGTLTLLNGTIIGNINLNGGFLGGSGTIMGALSVGNATVGPGFSPGSITVNGDLNLSSSSSLLFEIGGDQAGVTYDQLVVNGNAQLAGQLTTVNYGSYTPLSGVAYDVMSFNSSTGQFASITSQNGLNANLLSNGLQFTLPGIPASVVSAPSVVLASNSFITSVQNAMLEEDGGLVVGVSSPQPSPIQSAQEDKKSEEPLPACP